MYKESIIYLMHLYTCTAQKNERLVSGIGMALWLATGWGTTQQLMGERWGGRETSDLRYIEVIRKKRKENYPNKLNLL